MNNYLRPLVVVLSLLLAFSPTDAQSQDIERLGGYHPVGKSSVIVLADSVADGGFEGGTPSAAWTEFSTNFGTPICSAGLGCGNGGGTGPRTGSFWAWFGGISSTDEFATLSQSVFIPSGSKATLHFWLEVPSCATGTTEELTISVNNSTDVFKTDNGNPACGQVGYVLKLVNLSAWADGGIHTIAFEGDFFLTAVGTTNFFVDDVSLEVIPSDGSGIYTKVLFEGPYNVSSHKMDNDLRDADLVPLSQPFLDPIYNGTVLDFNASQTLPSVPDSVVDWVLVSLRSGTSSATQVSGTPQAALLNEDGRIVTPGWDSLRFADLPDGSYYLVIRSRNHLDIMSSSAVVVAGRSGSWDFTTAGTQAFGLNPQTELETGVWGMISGDASVDGIVTAADFNLWLVDTKAVATGYLQSDHDMDSQSTASDFNVWLTNTKAVRSSQVP